MRVRGGMASSAWHRLSLSVESTLAPCAGADRLAPSLGNHTEFGMNRILAAIRRHVRHLPVLLLTLAGAGCAPQAMLGYRPEAPISANLPLGAAGVRDARAAFAPLFERELRAFDASADAAAWLHTGPAAQRDVSMALEEIDRRFAERRAQTVVLVVPGLLGDCVDDQSVPFGDGVLRTRELESTASYAQYADLGLREIRLL